MTTSLKRLLLALAALMLALGTGCNKLKARDQLNKGVQAYKSGKYEEAIDKFSRAVELDPDLGVARLYLATAYVGQYVPGVDTPENNRSAEMAIEQYQKVLQINPSQQTKVMALKGIASLYFNMKKFDDAKQYHQKILEIDPNDPETYYSIGVIDWSQAYATDMGKKNSMSMKQDEPYKDAKDCQEISDKNRDLVENGIKMLEQAITLRKDYDDAMAYLNLMYRQKADIECTDPLQRQEDLKTADDWVQKAMATKRAKAEAASKQGGIVLEDENKK